jgi:hypothetical protein
MLQSKGLLEPNKQCMFLAPLQFGYRGFGKLLSFLISCNLWDA